MEYVESRGVRLAAEPLGEGPPVTVVGHGLTGSRRDFAPLAPAVPGTVVLFDFRGHGDSERPPSGSYSMDDFAADLDAVAERYDATRLVGVSLGAGAGIRLLHSRPDRFERLVFLLPARLDPGSAARRRLLRLARLLERKRVEDVARELVDEEVRAGEFEDEEQAKYIRTQALLRMNREGIPKAIREVIDDPPLRDPAAMSRVTAPALVIGQGGDPIHHEDVARALAAVLPNAELVLYPTRFALLRDIVDLTRRVAAFLAED